MCNISESEAALISQLTREIISVVYFSFVAYLTIGIPLAVVPKFVQSLGFGPIVAGIAISVQYVATFLGRGPAGRISDEKGPKITVIIGLIACGVSGIVQILAALSHDFPVFSLATLFLGRLILGFGESFVATAAILWGISWVGEKHTAKVISWNGIATYSAIAAGASLGAWLEAKFGFVAIGVSILLVVIVSTPLALAKPGVTPIAGDPLPMHRVFSRVFPYGVGLALGSFGFGTIATFITLYFVDENWEHAALCLTCFGSFFVSIRVFFAGAIDKFGGFRVAILCFLVEAVGLFILAKATSVPMAIGGAIVTGIGFSLVFPSLAVEAVGRVSADNRGAALGMFSVFVDGALGVTGPVGGWVAHEMGYRAVYLVAFACALFGFALAYSGHRGFWATRMKGRAPSLP